MQIAKLSYNGVRKKHKLERPKINQSNQYANYDETAQIHNNVLIGDVASLKTNSPRNATNYHVFFLSICGLPSCTRRSVPVWCSVLCRLQPFGRKNCILKVPFRRWIVFIQFEVAENTKNEVKSSMEYKHDTTNQRFMLAKPRIEHFISTLGANLHGFSYLKSLLRPTIRIRLFD